MSETNSVYTAYQGNSYLFGGNAPYVEELYEAYLDNPGSVPEKWRAYFDALQHVPAVDGSNAKDVPHLPVINAFAERAKQGGTQVVLATGANPTDALVLSQVVLSFGIPFAVIPLVVFTGRREVMGADVNGPLLRAAGYGVAAAITAMNVFLVVQQL